MNNLHLEYLRDTGNQPLSDMGALVDTKSDIPNGIYKELYDIETRKGIDNYPTPEYIQWLENKLNELRCLQ